MHEAQEDLMFDEPTVAEDEREALARENMVRAVAELVSIAIPVSAVLVVARGPGLPTGVLLGEHDRKQDAELDPVILAEILANAHDDRVARALTRLLLGDEQSLDHTVARDRHGAIVGVIALRASKRVSDSWLRTVLGRAASSLAGWLATESTWAWPPQSLLEAIDEPALAYEGGMVIVANRALARMLDLEPNDVVGMPIGRITQRLPSLRACSLVVGGRPRTALIFERRVTRVEANVRDVVDGVLADVYALVRQTSRFAFDRREDVVVAVAPDAVAEIVTIALHEVTAVFAKAMPANQVQLSIHRDDGWGIVELVATGALARCAEAEHLGSIICASRLRAVGGHFVIDTSRPDTRVIRLSLPVEA